MLRKSAFSPCNKRCGAKTRFLYSKHCGTANGAAQRTVRRSGQSSMPHRRDYIPAECVRLRGDSASSVRPRYCTAPSAERAARIAALRSRRESRRQSAADGGYASRCSSSRSRRSSGSSVRRAAARTSRPTVRMTRGIMRAVSLPSVLR